jgi:hypothetical protein
VPFPSFPTDLSGTLPEDSARLPIFKNCIGQVVRIQNSLAIAHTQFTVAELAFFAGHQINYDSWDLGGKFYRKACEEKQGNKKVPITMQVPGFQITQ